MKKTKLDAQEHQIILGSHMSIEGGMEKAIDKAVALKANCLQIFTKSNQQWQAKPITHEQAQSFIAYLKKHPSILAINAHASYLINLGSSNAIVQKKSLDSLLIELERCKLLNIPYLVLHPGTSEAPIKETLKRIGLNINLVLERFHGKVTILLENTAGQGNSIGYRFEHLQEIYNHIEKKAYIGYCFDTCHAFAAGYDFSTEYTYRELWQKFDAILGLQNLKLIHLNDSKKELGSRVDRHEAIGKGAIDITAFSLLCNDQQLFHIPKILETPKPNGLQSDLENMNTIYKLLRKG